MDFEIPGTGVFFVLNPDDDQNEISSFPVTLDYEWRILALIQAYKGGGLLGVLDETFKLVQQILNLSDNLVLAHAINQLTSTSFTGSTSPIDQVIQELNAKYNVTIPAPRSSLLAHA